MLLKSYKLEIVNNHCMPGAISVNAVARLDQDVSCVVPYLNAVLGGHAYVKDPPAVTFQTQGNRNWKKSKKRSWIATWTNSIWMCKCRTQDPEPRAKNPGVRRQTADGSFRFQVASFKRRVQRLLSET